MGNTLNWKEIAKQELIHAIEARKTGYEGKARVCARRAAGYIIGEYLRRHGYQTSNKSAYYRLKILQNIEKVSPEVREIAGDFLLRITPQGQLPKEVDLLASVHTLASQLLGEQL